MKGVKTVDEDLRATMFSEYPDVVTAEEIMDMLRIGKTTVYQLLRKGAIKSVRYGDRYIVPKKCVIDYLVCALEQVS